MKNTNRIVESMMNSVKRKPDYKALVPAAQDIIETTQTFIKDIEPTMDSLISGEGEKRILLHHLNVEEKVKSVRSKIIEQLELTAGRRTLGIQQAEIEELKSKLALNKFQIDLDDKTLEESYTLLVALKNAALLSASASVDFLASKTESTIICNWDPTRVMSSPEKPYIIKGETFKTDIFLYTGTTQRIEIIKIKVNQKELSFKDGFATYKVKPSVYGEYRYKAEIFAKNPFNGKEESFSRTFKFEVGERCY